MDEITNVFNLGSEVHLLSFLIEISIDDLIIPGIFYWYLIV